MGKLPELWCEGLLLRPFSLSETSRVQDLAGKKEAAATTLNLAHSYPDGAAEEWINGHGELKMECIKGGYDTTARRKKDVPMFKIVNVKEYGGGLDRAVDYIHSKWGSPKSYPFYKDAIYHSSLGENHLPRFYLLLKEKEIIGCAALLTNDYISRQDLYPWLACLFVEGQERGRAFGSLLMEFVEKEAKDLAFPAVYLTTEHDGYYEKYGWVRMQDGIDLFSCEPTRIYSKKL